MFLEQWKDTAFGSDYGGDFLDFLESFDEKILTLNLLYTKSNLEKFLVDSEAVIQNMDFNLVLNHNQGFEQIIHYEEAIIALCAVVVEALSQGSANMQKAYGSKILRFKVTNDELLLLKQALTNIYMHSSSFNLFDMIDNETKEIILNDISQMIKELERFLV